MADEGSKNPEPESKTMDSDISKEVLAPAEGQLRNNLVTTAVSFLRNERIKGSPLSQKVAFLERKGLTKDEIDAAIEKAGISRDERPAQQLQPSGALVSSSMPPLPPGMPPPYMAPLPSRWERMKDLTLTSVMVAGLSYSLYLAFQKYLRPWLFGKSRDEERLERLEAATRELQETLVTVRQAIETQTETLTILRDNAQRDAELKKFSESQGIAEVKAEITSLKGLLLSRRQFPPTPATSPLLPAWQREMRTGASSSDTSASVSLAESNSNTSVRSDPHQESNPALPEEERNGSLEPLAEEPKTGGAAGVVVDNIGESATETLP